MNIKFKNILDCLNYKTHCPFCKEKMALYRSDSYIEYKSEEPRLRFNLSEENAVIIDTITNEVEYQTKKSLFVNTKSKYSIIFEGIKIICQNELCLRYTYIVQIQIDIKNLKINDFGLNTEYILHMDDNEIIYEIKNNYISNSTEYNIYNNDTIKYHKIPLILPDLSNIKKTIDRINNLLIIN